MRTIISVIWQDLRHRTVCAWTTDSGRRTESARKSNDVIMPWAMQGAKLSWITWYTSRLANWLLYPARLCRGTQGR